MSSGGFLGKIKRLTSKRIKTNGRHKGKYDVGVQDENGHQVTLMRYAKVKSQVYQNVNALDSESEIYVDNREIMRLHSPDEISPVYGVNDIKVNEGEDADKLYASGGLQLAPLAQAETMFVDDTDGTMLSSEVISSNIHQEDENRLSSQVTCSNLHHENEFEDPAYASLGDVQRHVAEMKRRKALGENQKSQSSDSSECVCGLAGLGATNCTCSLTNEPRLRLKDRSQTDSGLPSPSTISTSSHDQTDSARHGSYTSSVFSDHDIYSEGTDGTHMALLHDELDGSQSDSTDSSTRHDSDRLQSRKNKGRNSRPRSLVSDTENWNINQRSICRIVEEDLYARPKKKKVPTATLR